MQLILKNKNALLEGVNTKTSTSFIYSFIPLGRRVSCADLGRGTHQGWIYTRKPRKTTWEKTTKWCVLKDANLFIYASQRVSMQNWDHRHN